MNEKSMNEKSMKASEVFSALMNEMTKVITGQAELCRMLNVCLIAGGHTLIEGVPGLGKTLAARTMAKAVSVPFKRVQFTPDLMPSDILGVNVFDSTQKSFLLRKGPIFTSFLLADEINRTPPKTQSALLEAMEEGRVTIDGTEYSLPKPFMVFATQNPIEYEGTYPLPEAQLDRFMMKLTVGYPPRMEETRIFHNVQNGFNPHEITEVEAVLTGEDIINARNEARHVQVEESLIGYILDILEATRKSGHILLGASPRAGIALMSAGKVLAQSDGRDFCVPEDFQSLAKAVLRHRILLTPDAEMEGLVPDTVLDKLISRVEVPR